MKLDAYEKEILDHVGNLKKLPQVDKKEMRKWQTVARETLKKDKRINIRMTEHDFESIQRKAIQEGLPYQTLISSLIHKYITGTFVEKKVAG